MIDIIFLGTSQAVPTAKRSHSAVLLRYKQEAMLIDCGEGTQRQFRIADINPGKITRLLITHWHGDHILGIPGLLQTLVLNGYNKTLHIYGPKGTKHFMDLIFQMFVFQGKMNFEIHEVESGKFLETEDFSVSSYPLNHSARAVGYVFQENEKRRMDKAKLKKFGLHGKIISELQHGKPVEKDGKIIKPDDVSEIEKGKKLVFLWDTAVCDNCYKASENADLLVIESSYSADMEEKAKEYKHLTSMQAAEIARKSGVKKLVLTHISQRFQEDEARILREAKKIFASAVIARDFMKIEL